MRAPNLQATLFRILMVLLCAGFSSWLAIKIGAAARETDFFAVYYQARCAVVHWDPYSPANVLREVEGDGWKLPTENARLEKGARLILMEAVYPPTTLLIAAPLAMLPWHLALNVGIGLMAVLLPLAAVLAWDLATDAPGLVVGGLICFMLLNCFLVMVVGNPAGFAVPLCVVAVWCFIKQRFGAVGVALMAVSLIMKPQDAGFVWLYFLLAGGPSRKRAWQTLAVVGVLAACAAIWIAPISPNWPGELHRNVNLVSARGGTTDPGPDGITTRGVSPIVCLQNTLSLFRDDPRFYNPTSYAIGGGLILVWGITVLQKRAKREEALLALAAISALTMLPVYHRPYDAKLLLLAVPACAMLWAGGGVRRWVALGLTAAAIFVTSDIPVVLIEDRLSKVAVSESISKLTLLLLQPAPVVLLATGCFYLWIYLGSSSPSELAAPNDAAANALSAEVAT